MNHSRKHQAGCTVHDSDFSVSTAAGVRQDMRQCECGRRKKYKCASEVWQEAKVTVPSHHARLMATPQCYSYMFPSKFSLFGLIL